MTEKSTPEELEYRLSHIQRLARTGIWTWDIATGSVEWSPEVYSIFGLEPGGFAPTIESIIGRFHPDARWIEDEMLQRAANHDGPYDFEARIMLPDGSDGYIKSTSEGVYDSTGTLIAIRGVVQDLTELKQAEIAVQAREEMLNETGRMARVGGWEHNLETGKAVWTRTLYDIIEIESGRPPGVDEHLDYYPEKDRRILEKAYRKAVEQGALFDLELQVHTATGTLLWCRVTGEPVFEHDRCIKLRGAFQDITGRKQAEEAVRASDAKYRELFEKSRDAIGIVDLQGNFITCNNAYADMLGYTPEELRNLNFIEVTPEKWRTWEMEEIVEKQIKARGYSDVYEKEYIRKDGTVFPVELRSYLMRDEDGNPTALWGFIRDISERKQMENQLQQSQKMEAVGTLAGGIAHDFNNILGGIIGYTELAQDEAADGGTCAEYLGGILKLSMRARDLVRQILTFSRKSQPTRKPIRLHGIARETVQLLRSTLPSTIEIRESIDESSGLVMADSTQMHQIMVNLATNAAHAMGDEGGELHIVIVPKYISENEAAAYEDIPAGDYLQLKVSDTGCGIDAVIMQRIFEPFFTTKTGDKGTGMGLAVVHGIVKSHGGAISVESRPEKGTAITILLPCIAAQGDSAAVEGSPGVPVGRERILFVDDEEALIELGQKILSSLGYAVEATQSSTQALELFRRDPGRFDAVVTDHTMPHITGYELAKQILALRADIPVVLCTGYSETVSEEKAKRIGIKEFVLKPFDKKELAETIRKVLDAAG